MKKFDTERFAHNKEVAASVTKDDSEMKVNRWTPDAPAPEEVKKTRQSKKDTAAQDADAPEKSERKPRATRELQPAKDLRAVDLAREADKLEAAAAKARLRATKAEVAENFKTAAQDVARLKKELSAAEHALAKATASKEKLEAEK